MVRLPPLSPAAFADSQAAAAKAFEAARGRAPFGPFAMLIRSPELMTAARAMGDYLRFHAVVGTRLSELAILLVARAWDQDYEWDHHAPIALREGVSKAVVQAIAEGRAPDGLSPDEAVVYAFVTELLRDKQVGDAAFAAVVGRWGERAAVDLAGLCGYYAFLAAVMNVARTEPDGPLRLPRSS